MSELKIYNSLSKQKEVFKPLTPNHVGMYVCGPTVYNEVHLGNVRTFMAFDTIFRWLKYSGYKVRYVRNITDVGHLTDNAEDKLAKQATIEKLEPMEVAQKYTNDFHSVLLQFNCLQPSIEPTASGHISEQIGMVQEIIEKGFAYEVNGSVYFDIEAYNKHHNYGILSGRKVEDMLNNTRELDGQTDKKNPLDFAIWKNATPEHIMRWQSPWGLGFPGWHLECSVMSTKYLGDKFDIHGGGMDLKFPHHECEIAQNEGSKGTKGANYWLHTNMLTVNGSKMSKSLGNGFTPKQLVTGDHPLLEKGFSPMVIRFFMLQTHYSSQLDFSNEALFAAEKGFNRLNKAFIALEKMTYEQGELDTNLDKEISTAIRSFVLHMNDDFNTATALADLFDLATKINAFSNGQLSIGSLKQETFNELKSKFKSYTRDVFGLDLSATENTESIDDVMNVLIELRQRARNDRDFATSDKIRDLLLEKGFQLLDGPTGTSWEKLN